MKDSKWTLGTLWAQTDSSILKGTVDPNGPEGEIKEAEARHFFADLYLMRLGDEFSLWDEAFLGEFFKETE